MSQVTAKQHADPLCHKSPVRIRNWLAVSEWSGSLGDLGTFLPLTLAMAIVCEMNIGVMFIFAGLMCIMSGLLFRQPIPVQPMKAIAAVAIAQELMPGQIAAAGVWMGILLFVLACTGLIEHAVRWVPVPVVRGIQAAIGIKLILKAITGVLSGTGVLGNGEPLPLFGSDSLLLVVLAAGTLVLGRKYVLTLPIVTLVGLLYVAFICPEQVGDIHTSTFHMSVVDISHSDWSFGLISLALIQLPLTLLNSVIAVCGLSEDYFPKQGVQPTKMAMSVACMNLFLTPFGAMPMCHGAGGLAAQYRFGARTGGSPVILGLLLIVVAIVFGGTLVNILVMFPKSILAVMVALAGFSLACQARRIQGVGNILILCVTLFGILYFNTGVGFLVGVGFAACWHYGRLLQAKT